MAIYYNSPCKIKTATVLADLNPQDFRIDAEVMVNRPSDVDIELHLFPATNFSDVAEITSAASVALYNDHNLGAPTQTEAGPHTDGAPDQLDVPFTTVPFTVANVGNTWKAVYTNLVVVAKDGQTFTIPSLTVEFTSPL